MLENTYLPTLKLAISRNDKILFFFFFQLLAISDFIVVVGGALLYGLPDVWNEYSLRAYPLILPYLLPMVQKLEK